MLRSIRRHLIGLALPLLMVAAPQLQAQTTPDSAAIAAGRAAAVSWLALVDGGQFRASWDSAASGFRAAVTEAGWEQAVLQARGPFEPFGTRTLTTARYTTQLPGAPLGEYVLLQFLTQVGGGRQVTETVVPVKDTDGVWRVSGYYIRPQ